MEQQPPEDDREGSLEGPDSKGLRGRLRAADKARHQLIPASEHRQRSLEGDDDGPLRSRIRDYDDERLRRQWLIRTLRRMGGWGSATVIALLFIRDEVTSLFRWIGSWFVGGGP